MNEKQLVIFNQVFADYKVIDNVLYLRIVTYLGGSCSASGYKDFIVELIKIKENKAFVLVSTLN